MKKENLALGFAVVAMVLALLARFRADDHMQRLNAEINSQRRAINYLQERIGSPQRDVPVKREEK